MKKMIWSAILIFLTGLLSRAQTVYINPEFDSLAKGHKELAILQLRHLPLSLGYVGAWSVPIKTTDEKVLGTFGTYLSYSRRPSEEELKGTALLAEAVAIVLTKSKAS